MWNRQRTDHELLDPDNTSLGHRGVMRWNGPEDWIISTKPAHPALVSEADFIAVQRIRAPRQPTPCRAYQLAGLLRCGLCGRRMDSCWAGHAAYLCRHGHSSASPRDPIRPPNAYVREDHILPHLPALLIRLTATEPDDNILEPSHAEPPTEPDAVEHLRTKRITLIFDPTSKTLTTDTPQGVRITIG
ncbi:recombinase zinc beta ribbon domain-containing protein [Streptomyces piniterrae]|uniref:recombinase zinc beta ribbon domain-containing protein n=1 Tax=Streptomyces piniterrae TaxID=2571125 RepID=UPI001FEB3AD2|nr:recombinase zinc beta ribbon domain-containing protein [Streptomyces piniterrae]